MTSARHDNRALRRFAHYTHGSSSSPAHRSGKTTTLRDALRDQLGGRRTSSRSRITIEYHLDGVSQIQVNNKKGLTFATGLRSLMRQTPTS